MYYEHETYLSFPSVWICDFKKLHCGKLMEQLEYRHSIIQLDYRRSIMNGSTSVQRLCRLVMAAGCEKVNPEKYCPQRLLSAVRDRIGNETIKEREANVDDLLTNMNITMRANITRLPDDMIADCSFNGGPCPEMADWVPTNYGACAVFNFGGNLSVAEAQSYAGLSLVVKLDVDDVLKAGSNGNKAGATVVIQDVTDVPRLG